MKLGIAVKLEDGWTDEFQGLIIANILEQLKYDDADLIQKLRNCYTTKLYNDCGIEVGHSESDFKLTIDPTFFETPDEEPKDNPDTAADNVSGSDAESISSQPAPAPHNIDLFGDGEMVDANTGIDVRTENSQKAEKSLAAFDQKVASAADKVAKATEAADDDSIIDKIISREDEEDQTKTPEPSLSPEEQRALRNQKSILGMTVVKPSANKTFISNPLVDPIKTRHDDTPAEPAAPADSTTDTDSVVPGFIRQEIKSANIISQKKRDN